MKKIELVNNFSISIFDLDGTVTDENEDIYEGLNEALLLFPLKKYIATGRNKSSLMNLSCLRELLPLFNDDIICYNGNAIFNFDTGELLVLSEIKEDKDKLVTLFSNNSLEVIMDIGGELFANSNRAKIKYSIFNRVKRSCIEVGMPHPTYIYHKSIMFIQIYGNYVELKKIEAYFESSMINTFFYPKMLIIYPQNTGKERGIREILAINNSTHKPTLVFGNDINDISMFKMAGLSVAVKNSNKEAAAIADVYLENVSLANFLLDLMDPIQEGE